MPCLNGVFLRKLALISIRRINLSRDLQRLTTSPPQRDFHKSSTNHFGAGDPLYPFTFANRLKKMNVKSVIDDLTQTCIELRRVVDSAKTETDKEDIVLKHIKAFSETGLKVNDFSKGKLIFYTRYLSTI